MSRSYGAKEARRVSDRAAEKHNREQGCRHLEGAKHQLNSALACFYGAKEDRMVALTMSLIQRVEDVLHGT